MGHLTLISEDVIGALEHYPPDLRLIIAQYAPQPAWDDYVVGRYNETKRRDTSLLGGGKPIVTSGFAHNGGPRWRVDEEDSSAAATAFPKHGNGSADGTKSEFRRALGLHPTRESTADFGSVGAEDEAEDESGVMGPPQVRILLRAMHAVID